MVKSLEPRSQQSKTNTTQQPIEGPASLLDPNEIKIMMAYWAIFGDFGWDFYAESSWNGVVLSMGTVDSNKWEHGCRVIYPGVPSLFSLGLEDSHVQLSGF